MRGRRHRDEGGQGRKGGKKKRMQIYSFSERERRRSKHLRPSKLRRSLRSLLVEISGFEKLQVRRTDLTSSTETPASACGFSCMSAVTSSMKTALPSYEAAALSLGQVQRHASCTHATATRVRPTGAAVRAAPTTLRAKQEHRQTTRPHCSGGRNSLSEILSTPMIVVPSLNNLSALPHVQYGVHRDKRV